MFLFYILLLAISMAVLAVVIMKTTLWMTSRLGHRFIENTHRSAEFIMETGSLPPFWFNERRYRNLPPLMMKILCLRRLKRVLSYFSRSPLTADEKTRGIIASRLTETYNKWTDMEWDEIRGM